MKIIKTEKKIYFEFSNVLFIAVLNKTKIIKVMNKKLYRGDGYIGGVCEGLGDWSGLPPILWRIAFIFVFPYVLNGAIVLRLFSYRYFIYK